MRITLEARERLMLVHHVHIDWRDWRVMKATLSFGMKWPAIVQYSSDQLPADMPKCPIATRTIFLPKHHR